MDRILLTINKIFFILFLFSCFSSIQEVSAQNIRISTQIDGFRHNHECSNDAATPFFEKPEPRYRVWV